MSETLVLVDEAQTYSVKGASNEVILKTIGRDRNIRFERNAFPYQLLLDIPNRCEDLLLLAASVYSVDKKISRGTLKDVWGSKWERVFKIILPVWEPEFWNAEEIKIDLAQTLAFLSGDEYHFDFIQRTQPGPIQKLLNFPEPMQPLPQVDSVILFSGGIDSLGATIEALEQGRRPILVSHRPSPTINSRQTNLVKAIRGKFKGWVLPHVCIWVNRTGGERAKENTQRSRSFLFTCLGAVAAKMLNVDEICLCDNGVVSFNLQQSGQNIGTFMTRSTHPKYMAEMQVFLRKVLELNNLKLINTLLFKTKKEVMQMIAESGHPELIQEATSCTHTEGQTKLYPHCGTCSQCVDRRFASLAARLEEHDLPEKYAKNIFIDELKEGDERTYSENYVRFADKLEDMNQDQFVREFPELIDCLPEREDVDLFASSSYDLFQRHQKAVNEVLKDQINQNSDKLIRGTLSDNCLIKMVVTGKTKIDPRIRYIDRLRSIICKGLRPAFKTVKAENEKHVQDIVEALLKTAEEKLSRECPQLPFAGITTKPDFSDITDPRNWLSVELKYPKDQNRRRQITKEINASIIYYRDQGAYVLFIVYDPENTITDDDAFSADFEKHEGIWVGISR